MSVLEAAYALDELPDVGVRPWLFTRDRYYQAGELGWFDGGRVELIEGIVRHKWTSEERLWTRAEYEQADSLGWFVGQRVELIQGKVYVKLPQNPAHVNCVEDGGDVLKAAFGPGFRLRRESPLPLPADGVPEPDLLIARGTREDFLMRHPRPDEVALLVEVSDTTLQYDQTKKAADYAAAGVADYWLLNLQNRSLEVRRDPIPTQNGPFAFGYRAVTVYSVEERVSPLALPSLSLRVADLLPPQA